MPTYKCASATIKLSVADLDLSTTQSPIGQPGKEQTAHLQSIADELKKGLKERPLAEIPLYTDEPLPSHLRFLGPHNDMPFLLVLAGQDLSVPSLLDRNDSRLSNISLPALTSDQTNLFSSKEPASGLPSFSTANDVKPENEVTNVVSPAGSPSDEDELISAAYFDDYSTDLNKNLKSKDRNYGASKATFAGNPAFMPHGHYHASARRLIIPAHIRTSFEPNIKPQALCLTVQLSKASFLYQSLPNAKKPMTLDVKIDVYFNGELCASAYVPERMRNESSIAELTQRFTGRRIERLLERPWVIVPTGQNADSSLREHRPSKGGYGGAQQRWAAVSELLMDEAEKGGRNKWGELTVLGKYLEGLANYPMPNDVENLQEAGGAKFGIIDVVLTAGHGKKDDPEVGYLSAPARMRIEQPDSGMTRKVASIKAKARPKTFADAEIIASGYSSPLAPRHASASMTTKNGETTPFNTSDYSLFQNPTSPLDTLTAVHRRNPINILTSYTNELPQGLEPASTDAISGTAHQLGTPDALSEISGVQSFTSFGAPAYDGLRVRTAEDMESASLMEISIPKRRKLDNASTTEGEQDLPRTPTSANRKHFSVPYHGRLRGPGGVFVKAPSHLKIKPIHDSVANRKIHQPPHVPQKRYEGAEAEREDDEPQEKKKLAIGSELVANIKPTLAEEMQATEDRAKELAVIHHEESLSPPMTRRGTRPLTRQAPDPVCAPSSLTLGQHFAAPLQPDEILSSPLPIAAPASTQLCIPRKILSLRLPAHKLATLFTRPHTPPLQLDSQTPHSLSPLSVLSVTPKSAFSTPPYNTDNAPFNDKSFAKTATAKPRAPLRAKAKSNFSRPKYPPIGTAPVSWRPSPLNEDSVITYAEGKVRQVKAERTGWFRESSVLMGVRFLVG